MNDTRVKYGRKISFPISSEMSEKDLQVRRRRHRIDKSRFICRSGIRELCTQWNETLNFRDNRPDWKQTDWKVILEVVFSLPMIDIYVPKFTFEVLNFFLSFVIFLISVSRLGQSVINLITAIELCIRIFKYLCVFESIGVMWKR